MAESEFKTHCRAAVRKFLESYISTVKLFDHDHLIKVSQNHPEFFERRTSEENEKLYVEWQLDKNRVRVAGLKRDVDSKVKEITSFLEAAEHRYVQLLICRQPVLSLLNFFLRTKHYAVAFKMVKPGDIMTRQPSLPPYPADDNTLFALISPEIQSASL